ncbi:MAG TPA: DNA-3-methyladenine glycosylase 2 family protein [Methylomirabilota bacterium]|nr:DNA-3-methyladenine glycosylase 2 family protein [Methylomirabilota bacterium]
MDAERRMPPFDLRAAMEVLAAKDERLARLMGSTEEYRVEGDPAMSPYEALTQAVVYQSISGKAAATIFARVKALGSGRNGPMPQEMLLLPKRALRRAGLSGAKIAAMKDLAQKALDGTVPSRVAAETMSDTELVERLTSVRGVGAWTVEMFLIFRLGRPDVLPIHDLGVQRGHALTYGKKFLPKPKDLLEFGERWRPYRTVASWYMWRACGLPEHQGRRIGRAPAKKRAKVLAGRIKRAAIRRKARPK